MSFLSARGNRRRGGFYNCGCEACKKYFGTGPDNPNWIPLRIDKSFWKWLRELMHTNKEK